MKKGILVTIIIILALFIVAELLVILLVKDKELAITLGSVICSLPVSALLVGLCSAITKKDETTDETKKENEKV